MISVVWKRLFQLITGLTGVSEALLGLIIVFFASHLQPYIDTGMLPEPLYLRILGVMDFYIGVAYILISFQPDKNYILNKWTCFLRLGLSAVFLIEGVWLLEAKGLRLIYQSLAVFDFFLFSIQAAYIKKTGEAFPVK